MAFSITAGDYASIAVVPRGQVEELARKSPPGLRISPVGIRSYQSYHKDFFLRLLPESTSADGEVRIPESVRFWIEQLADNAPDAFRVGCLWGRSGVGKSSFLNAALVPNLPPNVYPLQVRATARGTVDDVRRACDVPLPESCTRRLVIIDQFEQWLFVNPHPETHNPLVQLLGKADGARLTSCLCIATGSKRSFRACFGC